MRSGIPGARGGRREDGVEEGEGKSGVGGGHGFEVGNGRFPGEKRCNAPRDGCGRTDVRSLVYKRYFGNNFCGGTKR